jgi:2-oxoglutarate dehydrogenase E2 component (dihydrolipoamide succinyltransferase)
MSVNIIIPPLGESISEATVVNISKKIGSKVKIDEHLFDLETDKITLEVTALSAGEIKTFDVKDGMTVAAGQVIGTIDETASGNVATETSTKTAEKAVEKPAPTQTSSDLKLSPAVQRIASEENLDLKGVSGSGKDGRITKGDALSMANPSQVNTSQEIKTSNSASIRMENPVRMSKLRQTIAKRLKESQNTAAILTTFNEVDMTAVMSLRKEYQDAFTKKHGIKLGFMSFFIKACIVALKEIPAVNAEIKGEEIIYKQYADIGVAVGTESGLVVPVIRNAEQLNIAELEKAVFDYGQKAKEGKITLEHLKGGTFTISNGGTYGSLLSTPIINPPQSGILGMHKIQERPVAINGQVVIRPMMYLALSYDHRIIDGKEAVTFLVRVKELLEDPRRLVLDI